MTKSTNQLFEAAGRLAVQGVPVFPCNPENKQPLTPHGFKDASLEYEQIEAWWKAYPDAMIGVPTGTVSGFFAIDLDRKPDLGIDGVAAFTALTREKGPIPATPRQRTPSGGLHILFEMPKDRGIKCSTSKIGLGIDVRGDGGYIVIAPSVNAAGKAYVWELEIWATPFAVAPDWLLNLIGANSPSSLGKKRKPIGDETLMARDLAMLARALHFIPNDLAYLEWFKMLAARRGLGTLLSSAARWR